MIHPFKIGETYSNSNGHYEVIEINDSDMLIRYENGREQNVDLEIQTRIWRRVKRENKQAKSRKKGKRSATARKKKKRLKAAEREKLIGEILQDDHAIFEILTRLTIPPGQINTYRFFLKNPQDYFSMEEIASATRDSNQESLQGVLMAFGKRIANSPDPRVGQLKPYNSLFFKHKKSSGKTQYRIRQPIVDIMASYPQFYDFMINDNRSWLPVEFGSEQWTNTPDVHRLQMQYFGLWDRYQSAKKS